MDTQGYGRIGRSYFLMGQWGLGFGGRYPVLTAVRYVSKAVMW